MLEGDIVIERHQENNILHGISVSLTKRKIEKYQRKLGNGHDAELHGTVADLYKHLGEESLALESYHAAVTSVLQYETPLNTEDSDQLICLYKKILVLEPLHEKIVQKLGQEYVRRGLQYRAVELYSAQAERYAKNGDYQKATELYQVLFTVEPGSISARQTCAGLFLELGQNEDAAREYHHVGDIYFEHQRFDGALEYYKEALRLNEHDEVLKQKADMTQQILDGALIPQAQANLQKLNIMNQDTSHLKRSLAEKERVEQELRANIQKLKLRYKESVAEKNRQLRARKKRLEDLSTYVAVFKDNLEQVALEKKKLQTLLRREVQHKHELKKRLASLSVAQLQEARQGSETKCAAGAHSLSQQQRLESAVNSLQQERNRLKIQLQEKLQQTAQREEELRENLGQQSSQGAELEQKLRTLGRERKHVERQLQRQLEESLRRERVLREQMKELIGQHELALEHVTREKRQIEEKYRTTQQRMNVVEADSMSTLEQLHGELSRQCELESNFSAQFHESLQEISMLLYTQEREIQKLEQL